MNLFLIGWAPFGVADENRAEEVVAGLLQELPFFEGAAPQRWTAPSGRATAFSVAHGRAIAGGVTYSHFERDRFAMFSGRPFLWEGEFETDGRRPLDPASYLQPTGQWSDVLDGRCVAIRYEDPTATLDLYTDPLGAYHLFAAGDPGNEWFSNSVELLRRLSHAGRSDPLVLASLVGCGWSLGGRPLWSGVRRLPRGTLHRFQPGVEERRELLPTADIEQFFKADFSAEIAANTLVAAVRGLADWPRRPNFLPLTGGRDSRLVFAAADRSGVEFEPRIIASRDSESPDVRTARVVCESVGRALTLAEPRGAVSVEHAAQLLRLCAPGSLSLDLAWSALNRPDGTGLAADDEEVVPLPIVHSGHGGELARAYYGAGDPDPSTVERSLYGRIIYIWPRPPLSREGKQLIKDYIGRWVLEQLDGGSDPTHLPDLFYLLERMSNWVGASHGFDEYMTDLTSPLWTPRLLPHEFGLPGTDRSQELFHFHVLTALRPALASLPFGGSNPSWPTFGQMPTRRARRARRVASRAGQELQRRYEHLLGRIAEDSRVAALAESSRLALESAPERSHEVWQLLDRRRTLKMLGRDPLSADSRTRALMWRLTTVFLVCLD
jgi:hypothetical protein